MARIDLGKVVGDSATISVGNVTTLEAGENATVLNTGTELNGVFDFGIPKGPKGDKGDTGSQGPVGPQGVQGKAFTIDKTYSSVLDMEADFNNMEVGSYVMIASNVESEDNARLYYRDINEWKFISDFSGATGIQGEQGPQGQAGYTPVKGVDYFTTQDIAEIEDDIKEITGELANLDTTDKSNLVSAINEVASSGGGSDTLVYSLISDMASNANWNGTQRFTNTDKTKLTEIIQEVYNNGYNTFNLIVTSSNNQKAPLTFNYGRPQQNIQSKPTRIILSTIISDNRITDSSVATIFSVDFIVNMIWNGNTVTVEDALTVTDKTTYLSTANTNYYVPTSNYHPATKKYVDDSIAAAITTTLGGSY